MSPPISIPGQSQSMAYRNAPINPIMRLIYALLRVISWTGVFFFYRRRLVLGREHLRFDGPAIVVCNHPSTLMDPLNVGLGIRQEMFFLANYGLFKNPVSSWILTRLFCIPVKRKEDVAEGEARDNDASFEQSFLHLEKNGVLFVAAEGVSWMNRYVRPFKTGTARIAFGAERRNNWQLGVKIIPVGLTYDAPRLFRSRTTVEYGPAIETHSWKDADQQDHEKAVNDFTAALQRRVGLLIPNSGSEADDAFVDHAEIMLRNARLGLSEPEEYYFLKDFLARHLTDGDLKAEVARYFSALEKAGLTDAGLCQGPKSGEASSINPSADQKMAAIKDLMALLLLTPFFLLGYGFWFLPCYLPWLLCKRLQLYPGYDSNIKMLAGLFTFPLALWGAWKLAFWLLGHPLGAWGILALLIMCGYLAEVFMDIWRQWRERQAVFNYRQQNPSSWQMLSNMRDDILKTMVRERL